MNQPKSLFRAQNNSGPESGEQAVTKYVISSRVMDLSGSPRDSGKMLMMLSPWGLMMEWVCIKVPLP